MWIIDKTFEFAMRIDADIKWKICIRQECLDRKIELIFNKRDHSFSSSSLRKRVAEAQIVNKLNQ